MRIVALLVALLAIWIVTSRAVSPPPPLPASARQADFAAERAMADVRQLALRPHPTGSIESMRVRDYLLARLTGIGLAPDTRRYLMDGEAFARLAGRSGGHPGSGDLVDVVAVLPGTDRRLPAVALVAHYDTVPGSPGAGDDVAGVAAVLETVRALKARGPLRRDVLILFTDGEELGLAGARAFWSGDALAPHVGAVVNLDARGSGGRAVLIETGVGDGPSVALYARAVAHPLASTAALAAYAREPAATDFTPWRAGGGAGYNLALFGRPQFYHSPRATADRLDPASLQDLGGQALDLVAALAAADTLPARGADAAFFDVGGRVLVHYRAGAGWLLLLAGAALFAFARLRARRAGEAIGIGRGAQGLAWALAHATLALTVFERLAGPVRPLAALSRLEAQGWLAGLAALIGSLALQRTTPRPWGAMPGLMLAALAILGGAPAGSTLLLGLIGAALGFAAPERGASLWGGWLAAIGLLLAAGVIVQWTAPAQAWLFAWPALILAGSAAIVAGRDPAMARPLTPLVPALAAVLVVPPLLALGHTLFLIAGVERPHLPLLMLPAVAAAAWPIARWPGAGRGAVLLALMALVAGGALALHVRVDPEAAAAR